MRTPVDLPQFEPVAKSDDKRSRLPIIVFGARGPVAANTRWTAEELAVQYPEGAARAMHYLGDVIPFDEGDTDADRTQAFSTLLSWCTLAQSTGMTMVCAPHWYDYQPRTQDLLQLAARSQLQSATVADIQDGRLVLKPHKTPLRVVCVKVSRTSATFINVSTGRRPFDQTANRAWLADAVASSPTIAPVFATALGLSESRVRDVDAAKDVASRLRTQDWSGADIKRYCRRRVKTGP